MNRKTQTVLLVAVAVAAVVVYYVFNPAEAGFFPRCPIRMLTGLKCPGCGSQRALHQLLHLHFAEALRCNAMFVVAVPLAGVMWIADAYKSKLPTLYRFSQNASLAWVVAIAFALWWVLRNVFNF